MKSTRFHEAFMLSSVVNIRLWLFDLNLYTITISLPFSGLDTSYCLVSVTDSHVVLITYND